MSLRKTRSSRSNAYSSSPGFSSRSLGSYSIPRVSVGAHQPLAPVTINRTLLTPLQIDIDPSVQAVRTQEKEQIKTLNNRFVAFIDKVRFLEQQNKMLETKWKLLQEQTTTTSHTEPMLKLYITNLQKQLESLKNDKQRLDMENSVMHKNVDDYKTKFEDEINKRNEAETDFVTIKKDVDAGYLSKMDLDDRVSALRDEHSFFLALYNTELRELQESLKETSVVVQMNNSRDLNMDQVVTDVKAQYEEIAARSRQETEAWHKTKFEQMTAEASQYDNELKSTKGEIAELKRAISRLQHEIENAQMQRTSVEGSIADVEQRGDKALLDGKIRIQELEHALQKAKQDMARQVREYQELMNVKLALDIEISTYKKLLEGEEERLGQESILNIQMVPNKYEVDSNTKRKKLSPILIKTVETQNRIYR